VRTALYLTESRIQQSLVSFGFLGFWPTGTASRLRPDYLANFLHKKIWRTFYIEVLPDFLAYYFPRFHVQKDILSYLNITNWPSFGFEELDVLPENWKLLQEHGNRS
jgi:hypothetical protein